MMPLTRDFRETLYESLQEDPSFRQALLRGGMECLLRGEVDVGKSVLRDFINGTLGFAKLAKATGKSPKSLMRMFSPKGNPQANNLFEVIALLQKREGLELEVRAVKATKRRPIAIAKRRSVAIAKRRPMASSRPPAAAAKRRAA